MLKIGKKLHTSKTGFDVYVVIVKDPATTRISYQFYSISPKGKMSDIISIKRSKLVKEKNALDCLLDWDAFLEKEEIDIISDEAKKILSLPADILKPDKATMEGLHQAVINYIKCNVRPMGKDAEVFVEGEYGYIKTPKFSEYAQCHREMGYSRKELLHLYLIMGALVPEKTRSYDTVKKVDGKNERYYRFLMLEEM